MTIDVVDSPGHADFGGEVERGLSMVDGDLLLWTERGPLRRTRWCCARRCNTDVRSMLVVNKNQP